MDSRPMHSKLRWLILGLVMSLLATGCTSDNYIHWYEEAMQDDGSIVIVKKLEEAEGGGWFAGEPGVDTYGYRSPIVEFEDPKTGESIRWDPVGSLFDKVQTIRGKKTAYQLQPYALHFHENVPYMFSGFYAGPAYHDWGCPIPPYIIWRWESDHWQRIYIEDLPVKFTRRNLLDSGGIRIGADRIRPSGHPGMTVSAKQIEQWKNAYSWPVARYERDGEDYSGPVYKLYNHHIHHENIGDIKNCGRGSNAPVPELKHMEMR